MSLRDHPNVRLDTIEEQGKAVGRDWQRELKLPVYFEEWEALARIKSPFYRGMMTFIAMDQSETRLSGHPRLQPKLVSLTTVCGLELGHSGFVVGMVHSYHLGIDDLQRTLPSWLNLTLPSDLQGDFIVAQATFFDSLLADRALEGLKRNIFTHTCPVLWSPDGATPGTGALVQVALVPGDYPGCPNARVLKWTE